MTLLVVTLCPLRSHGALSAVAFEAANKLYEEGKFGEAASAYETLARSGETSALRRPSSLAVRDDLRGQRLGHHGR